MVEGVATAETGEADAEPTIIQIIQTLTPTKPRTSPRIKIKIIVVTNLIKGARNIQISLPMHPGHVLSTGRKAEELRTAVIPLSASGCQWWRPEHEGLGSLVKLKYNTRIILN